MSDPSGYEELYGQGLIPICWLRAAQGVATVSVLLTICTVVLYLRHDTNKDYILYMHIAWAWWLAAPPVWFSVEYFYLFKKYKIDGRFEAFKYGQDVASKAWLAIAAIMSGIVSKMT